MTRTVPIKPHYVHNFIGYQENYNVDYYIFASYNKRNDIFTICGYVSKEEFKLLADFYKKGDLRYRDDGSSFVSRAPLYEIMQSKLKSLDSSKDIEENIK